MLLLKGNIERVQVVQSSGDSIIDEIATKAVLDVMIIPYHENGAYYPIVATQLIVINFPKCIFNSRLLCKLF